MQDRASGFRLPAGVTPTDTVITVVSGLDPEFSTVGLDNAAPGTGEVVRVPPGSSSPITVAGGLAFPGGFAAGRDGSLFVSNWSIAPADTGLGSVVRIVLP